MACQNGREYITNSATIKPVPPVPNNPDDWLGIQRLLQDLQTRATQAIVRPSTLQQPGTLNTPRTGALPAPEGLTASGAGPISLDWKQYAESYLQSFSFFKVYRSAAVNNIEVASIVAITPATRFVDSNLVVSTTYYYWVAGVTTEGIEGPPATVSASFVGFGSTYLADLAVTTQKLANLAVTGPKIEAASVTAAKIDVGQLSAISADLGSITAGDITGILITGATIQTAGSGGRIVMDAGNAFAVYDNGGTIQTQIQGGANAGAIYTSSIIGQNDAVNLYDQTLTVSVNVTDTFVSILGGYLDVQNDAVVTGSLSCGTLITGTLSAIGIKLVTGYITIKDSGGTDRYVAIVS